MSQTVATSGLAVFDRAVEAAVIALSLAVKVPAPLKPIADQLIRSASSVPANLAEGHSRTGRDRAHLWRIAYGSAKEIDSHLQVLAAVGAVNRDRAEDALKLFDQVRARIWRLLHP
jgi:four helix bundle protein